MLSGGSLRFLLPYRILVFFGNRYPLCFLMNLARAGITMKRDLDLMRDILLAVEEWNDPQPLNLDALRYEGKTQREIEYQAVLLKEAGYILATGVVSNLDPKFTLAIYRMTTAGYDYLDSVRSPEVWRRLKPHWGKSEEPLP